jgi:hypothetical protein
VDILSNAFRGMVFRSAGDAVVEYGFRVFVVALAVTGLVVEISAERKVDPGAEPVAAADGGRNAAFS